MRPLFTLLLIVGLMGSMGAYIRFANGLQREAQAFSVDYATGNFEVVIERSFDCEPFEIAEVSALEVRLKGQVVYQASTPIPADQEIRFPITDSIELGDNEIIVVANRDVLTTGLAAIRATVLRNDIQLAQQTITADAGAQLVSGAVGFHVDQATSHDHSEHGH